MKTLSIIADFASSGGTRTYFIQLINYFSQNHKNHDIEKIYVFLMQNQNDEEIKKLLSQSSIFKPVILPRIYQFTIISKVFRKINLLDWYEFIFEKLTVNKILRYKPDAMIFSTGNSTRYFYSMTKETPTLIISHTLIQSNPLNRKYKNKIYLKYKDNCNPLSRFCSVSEIGKSLYDKYMTVSKDSNLYNVITNHGGYAKDSIIHKTHSSLTILTLGLLAGFKNPDLWLNIAKKITEKCKKEKIPVPDFIWAGEGLYFDRLVESTKNFPNIKFIGFKKDTAPLYQNADIYIQPSVTENCCLSVIEAMKYSLPCIVSNVGGLPEQVKNNYNGYLCTYDNENDFSEKLFSLIKNKNKRLSFGKASRKIFEEKYSQEVWEQNFSNIINTILNQ